ncbi:hypothetical protein HDV57DRAFT_37467 [Trichoderma longibrachiatum]|uniref:Uncharacterized protein n=1 Tax=Trichoderma longibrachiatum ATCC 18648 TaxID=983965 RepID=A0A2T4CHM4_TRILO|nr:hypothetical protein M440DRAFT_75918 [Trichoderma longibrachiatum ATCC 18648]
MHGVCLFTSLWHFLYIWVGVFVYTSGFHGGRVYTILGSWRAGPWNTCHTLAEAASRTEAFYADYDTRVLHALMLIFGPLFIFDTPHAACFLLRVLAFGLASLELGSLLFFPSSKMEEMDEYGRIAADLICGLSLVPSLWDIYRGAKWTRWSESLYWRSPTELFCAASDGLICCHARRTNSCLSAACGKLLYPRLTTKPYGCPGLGWLTPFASLFFGDGISSCTYTFSPFLVSFGNQENHNYEALLESAWLFNTTRRGTFNLPWCPKAALQARSATILHFSCYGIFSYFSISFYSLHSLARCYTSGEGTGWLYRFGNGIRTDREVLAVGWYGRGKKLYTTRKATTKKRGSG